MLHAAPMERPHAQRVINALLAGHTASRARKPNALLRQHRKQSHCPLEPLDGARVITYAIQLLYKCTIYRYPSSSPL